MDERVQIYLNKIEQIISEKNIRIPPSYQKMKNQLATKDYAMAARPRADKGEIDCFDDFYWNREIGNLLEELRKVIIELKIEKEQINLTKQKIIDCILDAHKRLQEIDDLAFFDDFKRLLYQVKSKNYQSARRNAFNIYRMMSECGFSDEVVRKNLDKISLMLDDEIKNV
ncbi:MAG: hypothetical protein J6T41_06615 [Neisseriaceae bacterium]|nr:hypothetical protein [Neisseriaceae bacterium]